jgi:hypothetical protein
VGDEKIPRADNPSFSSFYAILCRAPPVEIEKGSDYSAWPFYKFNTSLTCNIWASLQVLPCKCRLQVQTYRCNYSCKEIPVGSICRCWLFRPFRTAGRPLRSAPRGISWQVFLWLCICQSLPVERRLSKAKEETWIKLRLLCRLTRYGVERS